MGWHTTAYNSSSRESDTFYDFHRHLHTHAHTEPCTHKSTHINRIFLKDFSCLLVYNRRHTQFSLYPFLTKILPCTEAASHPQEAAEMQKRSDLQILYWEDALDCSELAGPTHGHGAQVPPEDSLERLQSLEIWRSS